MWGRQWDKAIIVIALVWPGSCPAASGDWPRGNMYNLVPVKNGLLSDSRLNGLFMSRARHSRSVRLLTWWLINCWSIFSMWDKPLNTSCHWFASYVSPLIYGTAKKSLCMLAPSKIKPEQLHWICGSPEFWGVGGKYRQFCHILSIPISHLLRVAEWLKLNIHKWWWKKSKSSKIFLLVNQVFHLYASPLFNKSCDIIPSNWCYWKGHHAWSVIPKRAKLLWSRLYPRVTLPLTKTNKNTKIVFKTKRHRSCWYSPFTGIFIYNFWIFVFANNSFHGHLRHHV